MRIALRPALVGVVITAATAVAGCSGNVPSLPNVAELTGKTSQTPIIGSPTEVYEHIARGALTCWFGSSGPLKADYVYHAEAEPAGKGGKAEIVIHERDRMSANPKGVRAYRIAIAPDEGATTLLFENLKMPEPMAKSMEADARRWSAGSIGCTDMQSGGWSESTPTPLPPAKEGKTKRTSKGD